MASGAVALLHGGASVGITSPTITVEGASVLVDGGVVTIQASGLVKIVGGGSVDIDGPTVNIHGGSVDVKGGPIKLNA